MTLQFINIIVGVAQFISLYSINPNYGRMIPVQQNLASEHWITVSVFVVLSCPVPRPLPFYGQGKRLLCLPVPLALLFPLHCRRRRPRRCWLLARDEFMLHCIPLIMALNVHSRW